MTNVTKLVTQAVRNADANRNALIFEARDQCSAFGNELDFDRNDWDVTAFCPRPAGRCGQMATLHFSTHDNITKRSASERTPLPEPFCSVIKAIVRLKKEGNPKLSEGPLSRIINAARYLAPLLADRDYDPCQLIPKDLTDACDAIKNRGGEKSTHYRLGQALEEIVSNLARYQVTAFAFTWKNTFKRVRNDARIGDDAETNRNKMVEEKVLDELARISHLVASDSDHILMAGTKLFHCAPWRVGEINTIPADCWVERQKIGPEGPVVDADGNPVVRCGIRYWPEKSREADIKWLPDVMVPVARSAVETLLEKTAGARALAHWYEQHIGRAWLPGEDLGPTQKFSMVELAEMFQLNNHCAARTWLTGRNVPIDKTAQPHKVARGDLELALLTEWNKLGYLTKDRRRLKRSDHLFLTFANTHNYRGTNPCMLSITTDQHFSYFFSGKGTEDKRLIRSVFERFYSLTEDKKPLRVNSHQFRHWLNTIAQRGGLNQMLVARWSGRREVSQNGEYDHMSGVELAEKARDMMESGQIMGILADVHNRLEPIERAKFRENVFATAHVTDLGLCDHDYFTAPCPELSDQGCGSCESLNIKKGDAKARERAEQNLDDTKWLLERAIKEVGDGGEEASNYVKAHAIRAAGLERILALHDDPSIPDGKWVRPTAESPRQFEDPKLREAT